MGKPANKTKAAMYRQSDKGRLARKFYLMKPEVKLRRKIKAALRKNHSGYH